MWSAHAEAEGLTLLVADNTTGYFGVSHLPGRPKPYQARVKRGGKDVHLGSFATAEEAALCVAGGAGAGGGAQPGGAGSRTTPTTATATRMARSSGPGPGPSGLSRSGRHSRAGLATTPQGAGAGTAS